MEFCVACCWWYVGLLFCPLQALIWQKWFSTQSWFIRDGLITDCGNFPSFTAIMDMNPMHIDCRSNHSFEEIKCLPQSLLSSYHLVKKIKKLFSLVSLGSLSDVMECLSVKSSTIWLVCFRSSTVESKLSPFCGLSNDKFSWYFC